MWFDGFHITVIWWCWYLVSDLFLFLISNHKRPVSKCHNSKKFLIYRISYKYKLAFCSWFYLYAQAKNNKGRVKWRKYVQADVKIEQELQLQFAECWLGCPESIRLNSISLVAVQPGSYASRNPILALLGRSWGWTNGTPGGHPISNLILAHGLSSVWMWLSHSFNGQNLSLMPFLSAISWTLCLRTLCASSRNLFEGGRGLHLPLFFLLLNNGFIDPVRAFHRSKGLLLQTSY